MSKAIPGLCGTVNKIRKFSKKVKKLKRNYLDILSKVIKRKMLLCNNI